MKKVIICIFCLVSVSLFAQNSLRFGVNAGVNVHGFNTGGGVDNDHVGFSVGGVADYRANNILALQSGVQFNQKGGYYVEFPLTSAQDIEVRLNYINVPILVKLRLIKDLHVLAGPQLGFLVGEKYKIGSSEAEGDQANSFDLELLGGLAYEFKNGFVFQASYSYGTMEVFENKPYKNSTLNFSVGYLIN